jgi:SpoVK/Ycf46/Vps4 family AAA+-type ATPase
LLAQAAANEASATLFTIRPSDILSKYHGESEKYLSKAFEAIKKMERAILFIDGNGLDP